MRLNIIVTILSPPSALVPANASRMLGKGPSGRLKLNLPYKNSAIELKIETVHTLRWSLASWPQIYKPASGPYLRRSQP